MRSNCISLAWTGKKAANGVGVGVAELSIVGIVELLFDHSRLAASDTMMFRCGGQLD
jgi:hypothetical protein